MKPQHFVVLLLVAVGATVSFIAVRSHLRSGTSQELQAARQLLEQSQWAAAERKACDAINMFSTEADQELATIIQADAVFNRFHLGQLEVGDFSAAKVSLQQIETASPNYGDAQYLLAYDLFYHQQRYLEAEDLVFQGLATQPNHAALSLLRLELMLATARWVEGCERLPTGIKVRDKSEAVRLAKAWTMATFLPDQFFTELDRRLGILANDEQQNANSLLDRLTHVVSSQSDCSSCYAGLADWYQNRKLREVAVQQLVKGEQAFQRRPEAVYLQQYLELQTTIDPTQWRSFLSIASPARAAYGKICLDQAPTEDEWSVWPIPVATGLQEHSAVQLAPEEVEKRLAMQQLWLVDRRDQLLAALEVEDFDASKKLLAQCWSDFGQEEMANWILAIK